MYEVPRLSLDAATAAAIATAPGGGGVDFLSEDFLPSLPAVNALPLLPEDLWPILTEAGDDLPLESASGDGERLGGGSNWKGMVGVGVGVTVA
jgi:hypothetical protein